MAESARDNNKITTMIGSLNSDGSTPTRIKVGATVHDMKISDGTTGSDLGNDDAPRDNSGVVTLLAVSNADGVTPVPLYVNSSGQLLVKST